MEGSEAQENDILYKITLNFWLGKPKIEIKEYEVVNETSKSYMVRRIRVEGYRREELIRIPKEDTDEPKLDIYNGHFMGALMYMYETTREEVESYGIPSLKEKVRKFFQGRIDNYTKYVKELEKDGRK